MLSLDVRQRLAGGQAFGDADAPGVWYVLPDAPRLLVALDGGPALRYTLFVPPPGTARAPRGWLVLTLGLAPSAAEEAAWRAELVGLGLPVEAIRPFPARGAHARLDVLGEGDGERAADVLSEGGATFAVPVDGELALVLWAALAADQPGLVARCRLACVHRLRAARMRVWADRSGARVGATAGQLFDRELAGVEIEGGDTLPEPTRAALHAHGMGLVQAFLDDAGAGTALSVTVGIEEALPGEVTVEGVLAPAWTAEQRAARLTRVDLDAGLFQLVDVAVLCPPWPADGALAGVDVTLSFPAGAPGEARTTRVFRFDAAGGDALFHAGAWAEEEPVADVRIRVDYRGGAASWQRARTARRAGELLIVEPTLLGIHRQEIVLGHVDPALVRAAEVRLAVGDAEASALLDTASPSWTWEAVTRVEAPGEARMGVRWLRVDGTWTEPTEERVGPGRVVLRSPVAPRPATVELLAGGDWSDLVRLVVEIEALPSADPPAVTVVSFERAGAAARFACPGGRYRWRETCVSADGVRRTTAWAEGTDTLLLVRDRDRAELEVQPALLGLGTRARFARVDLEARAGVEGTPARASFSFVAGSPAAVWRYASPGGAREWRHRLTVLDADGVRREAGWTDGHGDVLVLVPPS